VTALTAAASIPAQDLLGVTWMGATVLVDSHTGAVTPLGTGLFGQNGLGRAANGTFWSTTRISSTVSGYTNVDPNTGTATQVFTGGDLRALSRGPGNSMFAVRNAAASDVLVQFTPPSGGTTTIGNLGFDGVQGLALHQGVLLAWDTTAGLLRVDAATGAAVDPFPGVGGPPFQQSLCSHPDGRLLLGGGDSNGVDQLFSVDVATGVAVWIGDMVGAVDVRGLEPLGGHATPTGQGCNGAGGLVVLSVTGRLQVGSSFLSVSTNHASNALGVALFGLDDTSYQGSSLPFLLDPMLGTSGCRLFQSIDATAIVFSSAGTPATLQYGFALTAAAAGAVFHLQHACFEPVQGGTSWSNGVTLHVQ
jgi:hypothetical protein